MKIIYTYDAQGRPTLNSTYLYDDGWYLQETEEFVYDAAGNCLDHSRRNSNGEYIERYLYEYDATVSADVVSMPYYIPEICYPEQFNDAHKRLLEHWYTLDANYVLQYICDYEYVYDANHLEVADYEHYRSIVYPNSTNDVVVISHQEREMANVELYDLCGKCRMKQMVRSRVVTLNLSEMPAGAYLLKIAYADGCVECWKMIKY